MTAPLDNVIWYPWHGFYVWPREYVGSAMVVVCDIVDDLAHGTIAISEETFVALNSEEERFRSFAERYVIERALNFRPGHEQEDAWAAMLDAKGIYAQIRGLGAASFGVQDSNPGQATQAAPSAALGTGGSAFHSGGGGNPVPKGPSRAPALNLSREEVAAVLAASMARANGNKRSAMAKMKAAVARVGTRMKI